MMWREGREEALKLWASIGASFVQLRKQSGLTQRTAATLACSTQSRLSELELGKADMMVSTLQRWARVYGYTVEIHFVPDENVEEIPSEPTIEGAADRESSREDSPSNFDEFGEAEEEDPEQAGR